MKVVLPAIEIVCGGKARDQMISSYFLIFDTFYPGNNFRVSFQPRI